MEIRYSTHPNDVKRYTTEELRKEFLIPKVFIPGEINLVYSHVDRMIAGGATPLDKPLRLEAGKEIGAEYFLARREMGVINIGGRGKVILDGEEYVLDAREGLYVGMGTKEVIFESENPEKPAKFYINSAPAHTSYPTVKIDIKKANPRHLGSLAQSNERTIYQYVHPAVCKSCQLVMGLTVLEPNNVWNTMPCHTHERRMEVYMYFDMKEDDRVFHFMGEPGETRHIVVKNEQAVISPSWSIHSGVGTSNYSFIWGMAGENQTFDDMDAVSMEYLK
ncbi:4-deoxy-L-threo-5-hexosulose-uronate ketol-isomerase KduI [Thermoclostridium stercorarium subsp. stercorarium DSM 8532]|uniref:4-deoxy-L-threo-5-hexosulose-uronate ketol-isomerase n=2 Tax=Thermoclostridium stercorarium TaxID=1510 RepID=L7VIJ3_THES1|nr:5-dehydro-4-deoxy-D-glucuronate isomerase [Thermoclostridium stercorarium]AGC67880.1 4-deoxy-L-threo-5-hexosulose-uronate ketol-isomerase KduI [Thermoclostridium stercorarium subsp. stercorarium DSM 8532]AGI38921.1 4-deoxy-L-threo-5-hexulose uronate isomerase [Thermoclostridium stercorarium subsp. stercorarium DSM 8532]ANW98290.1 5-keto-4-deoxyuronate isomerase [Thermoclostridium stercorarium subsp. thermolacticum DSM 2910]